MKFFNWLGKIIDQINFLVVIISAILLIGLTFIVGADITLRYLLYRPLGWVKEVSEYILVALGFLVAAWILKDDAHVKMDLILSNVSPRVKIIMNLITSIISTIVVLIITFFSLRVIGSFYKTKLLTPSVLEPPQMDSLNPHFCRFLAAYSSVYTKNIFLYSQVENTERRERFLTTHYGCCEKVTLLIGYFR